MTKTEKLHELYNLCRDIDFNEAFNIVAEAKNEAEADFFMLVTDYVLQQKQKEVIAEKRF